MTKKIDSTWEYCKGETYKGKHTKILQVFSFCKLQPKF